MAFFDNALLLSNAQAITTTAASTNLYDVTGTGSGSAPNQIFGTSTVFGADIGQGDGAVRPTAYFTVPTAFTSSGSSATLTIAIQAAIDNGSGSPSSYTTIVQTDAITTATLAAGTNFSIPIPPLTAGEALPRFYRFNYTVASGPFTAGTLTAGILLNPPTQIGVKYPNNFTVV